MNDNCFSFHLNAPMRYNICIMICFLWSIHSWQSYIKMINSNMHKSMDSYVDSYKIIALNILTLLVFMYNAFLTS